MKASHLALALGALRALGPSNAFSVGAYTGMTRQMASGALKRLSEQGLAVRSGAEPFVYALAEASA